MTGPPITRRSLAGVATGASVGLAGCSALDRNHSYLNTTIEVAPLPNALTKEQYRQYVETELSEYAGQSRWFPPNTPLVPLGSWFERDVTSEFTWEGNVRVPQTLHSFLAVECELSEFDPTVSLVIGVGQS